MIQWVLGFFGVIGGYWLGKIAQEELSSGKKYISILKEVLFYGTLLIALFFLKNTFFSVAIFVFIIIYYFVHSVYKEYVSYVLFVLLYFLVIDNSILPSLIFLYGLSVGSLLYEKKS